MKYRDEFDDPKEGNFLGSVGPKAAFFIVLIALSFMIGVVWKLYVGGGSTSSENVPIVRADAEPYKVEPDDPGGMEMPHKDSTIFSSLNSDPDSDKTIENLLADDEGEDPLPRSQLFAGLNTESDPSLHAEAQETSLNEPLNEDEERIVSQAKEAERVVTSLVEDGADAITTADEGTQAIEEAPSEKVEPIEKAVTKEKPEPVKESEPVKEVKKKPESTLKAMATGDYYVQLASVKDATRANSEWGNLQKKYSSALAGYTYRVQTADLGAKGVFYRIQAGPVSKEQATTTCNAIKKKTPSGCLVKKK